MKQALALSLLMLGLPLVAQAAPSPSTGYRVNGSANLVTENRVAPNPVNVAPPTRHRSPTRHAHKKHGRHVYPPSAH